MKRAQPEAALLFTQADKDTYSTSPGETADTVQPCTLQPFSKTFLGLFAFQPSDFLLIGSVSLLHTKLGLGNSLRTVKSFGAP